MNTFGENIKLTIFGESHGDAIGMVLDQLPAGEDVDISQVVEELAKRGGQADFCQRTDERTHHRSTSVRTYKKYRCPTPGLPPGKTQTGTRRPDRTNQIQGLL